MKGDEVRTELETRRRQLAAELTELTRPPEPGSNLSFGKRIGDGTTQAVERINSTATARAIAGALADVDRALQKLEEGTYGRCDRCGKPIGSERLEAKPSAALCIACGSAPG